MPQAQSNLNDRAASKPNRTVSIIPAAVDTPLWEGVIRRLPRPQTSRYHPPRMTPEVMGLTGLQSVILQKKATTTWYSQESVWRQFETFTHANELDVTDKRSVLLYLESKWQQRDLRSLGSLAQYIIHLRQSAMLRGLPWSQDQELKTLQAAAKSQHEPAKAPVIPLTVARSILGDESTPTKVNMMLLLGIRLASRVDELMRLRITMINWYSVPSDPPPNDYMTISWGRETKSSRLQPNALRFVSILATSPSERSWLRAALTGTDPSAPVFTEATLSNLLSRLSGRGCAASRHSFKMTGAELAARIIAMRELPLDLFSEHLKHKGVSDNMVPQVSAGYGGTEPLRLLALRADRRALARHLALALPWDAQTEF